MKSSVKRKSKKKSVPEPERLYREGLGRRVRQVRAALGLTQGEMAALFGRSKNDTISRLERGDMENIPFDLLIGLQHLAVQAKYTAAWLLAGEEPPMTDTATRLLEQLHRMAAAMPPPKPPEKEG
jgi:transcriptional regulator with XRE-family HTH domain